MSGVVVDTSVWIDFFAGRPAPELEDALRGGLAVLAPAVVAELVSGARRSRDRAALQGLIEELPVHETPLAHWVRVGELRLALSEKGVSVSTPDAHVAQCALDRDAVPLSRDAVFAEIARHYPLRVR